MPRNPIQQARPRASPCRPPVLPALRAPLRLTPLRLTRLGSMPLRPYVARVAHPLRAAPPPLRRSHAPIALCGVNG
ncbi:MAG: hypothetical protein LBI02_03170 [Opitutaceae bacterium]|nr:hypothetical protein [Opitutaceae bacterium]